METVLFINNTAIVGYKPYEDFFTFLGKRFAFNKSHNAGTRNNIIFSTLRFWGFHFNDVHVEELNGLSIVILKDVKHPKIDGFIPEITILIGEKINWSEVCGLIVNYSNEIESFIIDRQNVTKN